MTIFQAIILGVLQGLAEFLPISSSAHLSLAPWFLGWDDPGLSFDVALHVGTLVAVLWYFRAEWIALTASALRIVRQRRVETHEDRQLVYLIVATIPAAIAGFLLEEHAETVFRAPWITASALIVLGVILWAADRYAARDRLIEGMRLPDALLIGLAQVVALVPGVSRSGSTMTAGRLLRFDRRSAAVFSFLMSMPVTAAAAILKVPDVLRSDDPKLPIVIGVITAGVSSWFAIAVLLRYLQRHSFGVFAIYRVALGVLVFVLLAVRG
jgi:undecaprenyl-diphosphatase